MVVKWHARQKLLQEELSHADVLSTIIQTQVKSSMPVYVIDEGNWERFCLLCFLAEELNEFVTPRDPMHDSLDLWQNV